MTQEKLEQRAKDFYINADESENENGMYQWMAVFARAELQKAEAAIIEEIATITGPTGGWLDSPKAIAAELTQRIRKLMD